MYEIAGVRAREQLDLVQDQLTQVERKLESLVVDMEAKEKGGNDVPIEGMQGPDL
jgi:hypothetical protein